MTLFRLLFFFIGMMSGLFAASPIAVNGFDLSNTAIPKNGILSGGPPRDGIPAIDAPKFVPAGKVNFLQDDDMVVGFEHGGLVRAYPLRILVWHEIVNDVVGGKPVAVTYCPLCGTSMVFDAAMEGKRRSFGVSGLLYNSDVLMYDRETESLWSQLAMQAVSGPDVGKKLNWLPSEHMTWKAWREKHPDGEVLSKDTGHQRDYGGDAYASYLKTDQTMFPVPRKRTELPNKEWVLGVIVDGKAKAYPVNRLRDAESVSNEVGGQSIRVLWDAAARSPQVKDSKGNVLPSVMVFWFAWQAFYPDTDLWKP